MHIILELYIYIYIYNTRTQILDYDRRHEIEIKIKLKSQKNITHKAPLLYATLVARDPFRVTLYLGLGLGLLPADSLTDANCPNEKNVTRVERVYIG